MSDTSIIFESTSNLIRSSKKKITILFTDIEESTKYWDKFGDIEGRLMVDRHNRLLFPLVAKFKGRIIKTIGDSIMATFNKPEDAIKAAIAMQQTLAMERQGDELFKIRIRIGIHTGYAIVEKEDVFGDIVNVASRIEKVSKGDEILLSQTTVAHIDDEFAFIFNRKGWFVPKGKNKKLYVFCCDWENHPRLISRFQRTSSFPVSKRQKIELGIYLFATIGFIYFIYLKYLRYFLSDSEDVALMYLNFRNVLQSYPFITAGIAVVFTLFLIAFIRKQLLPLFIMRLIKGGFSFAIGFILFYIVIQFAPVNWEHKWDEIIDSSRHLYVEVLENNSPIFEEPSLVGQEIMQIHAGQLLLQTSYKKIGNLFWNKVLLDFDKYGWIVRVSPPQMGVPEKRVSHAYKFYFRYKDLYAFAFGLLCFFIGFWKFRLRPI